MEVALYVRVSTGRQEAKNQLSQLRQFAKKQGWKIVREYSDTDSGSKADRKEFKRLFADAAKREFDLVLFWALDRFSREGASQTLAYLNRLENYGVGFRSFTEPYFDSCGAFKDAILAIMATLAKQERIKISERTIAGLQRARAEGKTLGRPRCEVDLASIRRLRRQGQSWRQVGQELGVSAATALLRCRLEKGSRNRSRRNSGNAAISARRRIV
ncbi:MAG: recombinase family protein [Candidatus Acidiferrales bacterium]